MPTWFELNWTPQNNVGKIKTKQNKNKNDLHPYDDNETVTLAIQEQRNYPENYLTYSFKDDSTHPCFTL